MAVGDLLGYLVLPLFFLVYGGIMRRRLSVMVGCIGLMIVLAQAGVESLGHTINLIPTYYAFFFIVAAITLVEVLLS